MTFSRIITHASCPDGMASALILAYGLDMNPEDVFFGEYGKPIPEPDGTLPDGTKPRQAGPVLFCDFSPPKDDFTPYLVGGAVVLDHHPTAKPIVDVFAQTGNGSTYANGAGISGATLALDFVRRTRDNEPVARDPEWADLATLAGIRDTWTKTSPRWREACEQAMALTFYPFADLYASACETGAPPDLSIGRFLLTKREAEAKRALARGSRRKVLDVEVLIFDGTDITSDAAEAAEHDPALKDVQLVVGCRTEPKGGHFGELQVNFSMRSHTGFDCGGLAAHFGGGGHRAAAGFRVPSTGIHPWDLFARCLSERFGVL